MADNFDAAKLQQIIAGEVERKQFLDPPYIKVIKEAEVGSTDKPGVVHEQFPRKLAEALWPELRVIIKAGYGDCIWLKTEADEEGVELLCEWALKGIQDGKVHDLRDWSFRAEQKMDALKDAAETMGVEFLEEIVDAGLERLGSDEQKDASKTAQQ